jgi:2-dehydropantoate 2-reductase
MNSNRPIGVAGAGSIGCFVGGMLAVAGHRVALLARPRVISEIKANGLRLTGFDGSERKIAANRLTLSDDPSIFGDAGAVLVTVKSADTAGMADSIAGHAPKDAVIVSLQNGVGNVASLRERLAGRQVLGGMVPFNVVAIGEGRFHRSTSGDIYIEQDRAGTAERLSVPGLKMRASGNIAGQQWGRLLADQMAEGIMAIRSERISPVSPTPIPSAWMPPLLRLPDGIFGMLLGRTMQIDPQARSSMWEDLQRGRRTEIDYLQGIVTALADRHGLEAPLSHRVVELVRQAEAAGQGSPGLTPDQIRP